ncbi:PREDICTED: uncharacterized protein LOC104602612 [Nelumbo nucifera]|uniref:Uncharacterized protein LOC104602612 n=1 Tax=Nelumbo nucifera TaxID=4432 RepID=A0A1U8Q691_NELNU|nr:PREDICTED: uncharacterized protein LOC104602612 [Nelumbo nucifera]
MPSPMPMRAWRQESPAGSCYLIPTMAILQGCCSSTRDGFPPFLPLKIESLDFGDGSGSFILTSSGSAPGSGSTRNKKRFAKFSTALQYLVLQEITEETEQ